MLKELFNTKPDQEISANHAVLLTMGILMAQLPQHKEYLKQFPVGKDFVFDVVEANLEESQTVEEYTEALMAFLPEAGRVLKTLHTVH